MSKADRSTHRQSRVNVSVSPKGNISITVPYPDLRYINRFLGSRAATDVLSLGVFPNAKEITESFACYEAATGKLRHSRRNSNMVAICVGDGTTPRTGATFAFYSGWGVLSIDPLMGDAFLKPLVLDDGREVTRLKCYRAPGEVFDYSGFFEGKHAVLVMCHSHAPLTDTAKRIMVTGKPATLDVVSLPCCVKDDLADIEGLYMSYEDWGVHSAHYRVNIYRDVHNTINDLIEIDQQQEAT